jgi:hypothetical protein
MIIKSIDNTPINQLTKGSHKKVWVTCDICGVGMLREYRIAVKRPEDYCGSCQNRLVSNSKESKVKKSNKTKELWKNKNYREVVVSKLSSACKKGWENNKERIEKIKLKHKTPYEELVNLTKSNNFTLLTTKEEWFEQKGNKVNIECFNGHQGHTTLSRLKEKRQCIYCAGKKVYIPELVNELNSLGYKLIDYSKNKITIECSNGHLFVKTRGNWLKNKDCPYCVGTKIWYNDIKQLAFNNKLTLMTTKEEWEKNKSNGTIRLRCLNGHQIERSFKDWRRNPECQQCKVDEKWKYLNEILNKEGYSLLTTKEEWINNTKQNNIFWFRCPNGHEHYMQWNNWFGNQRCGKCWMECTKSKTELEIKQFLSDNDIYVESTNILFNGRRLEIDIFDKETGIGIEFNGNFFHREGMGKGENYHLYKQNKMEEQGYFLIQIFEDEWKYKRDIVESRLLVLFNKQFNKLYARKCVVKEINTKEAKDFINTHHLGGYAKSTVKLGLYHDNSLVSVMTFSKGNVNVSKGVINQKSDEWELNRYCSKGIIVGGPSKLLAYFKRNYKWEIIYSYADRRWSQGMMYYKLGFQLSNITSPTSWYVHKNNLLERKHRSLFIHGIIEKGKTKGLNEWEAMQLNGYDRIWDCGHYKFIMKKGE